MPVGPAGLSGYHAAWQAAGHAVHLRLGREPVTLPEPLAGLLTLGDQGASQWLFPGGPPRPADQRLPARRTPAPARPAPRPKPHHRLFGLATELPAAVLVRLLGIHIKVAAAWQRASAGDWTTYAAHYSRRKPATNQDAEPATKARG